jgi:hypothetical protein
MVAEIDGDSLVIRQRHHGQAHETRVRIADLIKMLANDPGYRDIIPE